MAYNQDYSQGNAKNQQQSNQRSMGQGSSSNEAQQRSKEQKTTQQYPTQNTARGNASSSSQNTQQNIQLVKRLYEEVYSGNDVSALEKFFASNATLTDPAASHARSGIKAFTEIETTYQKAFPNKKTHIDDIFATEDKVVVRWTTTGKQTGALQGIPASNNNVKVSGISIYKFANGKIVEAVLNWDRLGLLEQIGEVQPAEALH